MNQPRHFNGCGASWSFGEHRLIYVEDQPRENDAGRDQQIENLQQENTGLKQRMERAEQQIASFQRNAPRGLSLNGGEVSRHGRDFANRANQYPYPQPKLRQTGDVRSRYNYLPDEYLAQMNDADRKRCEGQKCVYKESWDGRTFRFAGIIQTRTERNQQIQDIAAERQAERDAERIANQRSAQFVHDGLYTPAPVREQQRYRLIAKKYLAGESLEDASKLTMDDWMDDSLPEVTTSRYIDTTGTDARHNAREYMRHGEQTGEWPNDPKITEEMRQRYYEQHPDQYAAIQRSQVVERAWRAVGLSAEQIAYIREQDVQTLRGKMYFDKAGNMVVVDTIGDQAVTIRVIGNGKNETKIVKRSDLPNEYPLYSYDWPPRSGKPADTLQSGVDFLVQMPNKVAAGLLASGPVAREGIRAVRENQPAASLVRFLMGVTQLFAKLFQRKPGGSPPRNLA